MQVEPLVLPPGASEQQHLEMMARQTLGILKSHRHEQVGRLFQFISYA